jgi:ribosomal protein S18 acetylase RimI-like enzyme
LRVKPPRLEIRPASVEDVETVGRLVREAYEIYVPRIGREPAPMTADYDALVRDGAVWVAREGDAVVGVLVLHVLPEALLLENVAVAPAAQGRGIGRTLIGFAERRAGELGLGRVELYTNERMTENIGMYGRLGYVEVDRRGEGGFARVFFEKTI